MKKQIAAFILAALTALVVFPANADGAIVISAGEYVINADDSGIDVVVSVSDISSVGLSSVFFNVRVPGAEIVYAAASPALKSGGLISVGPTGNSAVDGVNFMWCDFSGGIAADSAVAEFSVEFPGGAVCGAEYPVIVTVSEDPDDFLSADGGSSVAAIAQNGSISVPHTFGAGVVTAPSCTEAGYTTYACSCGYSYTADELPAIGHNFANGVCSRCGETVRYGDVNGDGAISIKDIIFIRRFLADYNTVTGESSVSVAPGADANGDGNVTTKDIILLRRYLASYDSSTGTSTVVLGPQG